MNNKEFSRPSGEGAVLCDDQPARIIARDLQLVAKARRQGWLRDPECMQRIADRVVKIALENPDDELALKAVAEVRQMVAQDMRIESEGVPSLVAHQHLHQIVPSPVTVDNLEQQRARLLGELNQVRGDTRRDAGGG